MFVKGSTFAGCAFCATLTKIDNLNLNLPNNLDYSSFVRCFLACNAIFCAQKICLRNKVPYLSVSWCYDTVIDKVSRDLLIIW